MLGIRVVALEIHGPKGPRVIDLDHPFVAVHGPTNSGKTSLADAISYCLGQKVEWRLAFSKYVTLCVLRIRIGDSDYILRRPLGKGGAEIEIFNIGHELLARLPVKVAKNDPGATFSDWILSELMLKDVIDSDEIRALNSRTARLTFSEVWPYLYRMQSEIDRQVILHAGGRDGARRTLFELLFGLSDPKARLLDARLKECRRGATEQERILRNVQAFFADTSTPPEKATVEQESAVGEMERITAALQRFREVITQWEKTRRRLRTQCEGAQQAWHRASATVERLRAAQLAEPRDTTHRPKPGRRTSLTCCPACSQAISPERASSSQCVLCLQEITSTSPTPVPEPTTPTADDLRRAEEGLARASVDLTQALKALESHETDDPKETRLSVVELTGQQAACRERIEQLKTGIAHSRRLQELQAGVNAAQEESASLKREIAVLEQQKGERGQILTEIEKSLYNEVSEIAPPWFNGSVRLDRERYLPQIDGQSFSQLGGGVRAAVNVAYSLALLRHSAALGRTEKPLLPCFLIVDAIRKNIGSNKVDEEFSARLYWRAFAAGDALRELGRGQVIVLDNDGPPEKVVGIRAFKSVKLSHEEPLIPGVSHADTGEDPMA
ncbi:AAA family ATPase [Nocardiopsis alba]|uniref:AAA family ATPase n=1 Tax=Nocardiopsis alba TaxID=53437 RepID=UPI003D755CB2